MLCIKGQIYEIHNDLGTRYSGARGTRDLGLLESPLAQHQTVFGGAFLHTDLFEMLLLIFFTASRITHLWMAINGLAQLLPSCFWK